MLGVRLVMILDSGWFDFKGVAVVVSFLNWDSAVSISDVTVCLNEVVLKCSEVGM